MKDFTELTGRKFKIIYKDCNDLIYRTDIRHCNLKIIEGTMENFNPSAEVVINSKEYGFNIIPYKSIVYMVEIKEL